MPKLRTAPLVATALWLAGCGSPAAGGDFQGQPLATIEGSIQLGGDAPALAHPCLGLVWISGPDWLSQYLVGEVEPVTINAFPANFTFSVHELPPSGALAEARGPDGGAFALAQLWAIDDVDGDGTFALAYQTLTYSCQGSPCQLPYPATANLFELCNTCQATDAGVTSCTADLVGVAPPDTLVGLGAASVLYVTSPAPPWVAPDFGLQSQSLSAGFNLVQTYQYTQPCGEDGGECPGTSTQGNEVTSGPIDVVLDDNGWYVADSDPPLCGG